MANRFFANAEIVFYRLTSKVVSMEENISEKSKNVAYFTLAVGHHSGVLDCFTEALRVPYSSLEALLELLPQDGYTHFKLEGLRKFGEINIERQHAVLLLEGFAALASPDVFVQNLTSLLQLVVDDPTIYVVAKRLV
jgi:hypothetical protein